MEKTFFIIGSYFVNKIELPLSKYLKITGNAYLFLGENECVEHYVKRMADSLRKQLILCSPDYLVIELQNLLQLFSSENPCSTEKDLIDKAFDELVRVIKANFSEKRVFVIQTHESKYYIMADELIRQVPTDLKKQEAVKKLNQYENYVQKEVGGILINTTSFYFYKKKRGYLLNDRTYEDECYIDISKKISNYVIKGKKIPNTPNPGCTIDRYVNYAGKTIQWKALNVFLNNKNIIDQLILSAPTEFVRNHKKALLVARKVKITDFKEWVKKISEIFADDQEFCNILISFYAAQLGMIQAENISFRELFKNSIVSRNILKIIQKYVKDAKSANPNQVTPHNAGYYYAIMIGKNTDEALGYVEDNATIAPILVDIFGTCISRICLHERYSGNTSLSVNKYWFQVPAYVVPQKKVEYDSSVFEQLSGLHTQVVNLQLENKVLEDIRGSCAQWLLIDLFGLSSPYIYSYKGFLYSDFEGIISERLGSEKVNVLQDTQLFNDWDDILKGTDVWIDAISEKYGDRIILVQVNYSYLSKGDDNVIYSPRNKMRIDEQQSFQDRAFEYVKEKLHCYTIEITHEFCPDDCGFPKRNSVHYSYDFYRQAAKLIEYIVYNEPKQRKFDNYDNNVRISRMVDMLKKNEVETVRRFFSRPLDETVLKLPVEIIRKHEKVIVSWYEKSIEGVEELLDNWRDEWDVSLKNEIVNCDKREVISNPVLPGDYPEEPVFDSALGLSQ